MRSATLFLPARSALVACASFAAFAAPHAAWADEAGDEAQAAKALEEQRDTSKGVVLGLRTGVGFAVGTTYGAGPSGVGSRSFSAAYDAMIPVTFDVGYHFGRLHFGPWLQYGFAVPSSGACPSGLQCNASDIRLGFGADWHLLHRATWDPWVGLGFGYEWTAFHASGATTLDESLRGFELFDLELGMDFDLPRSPVRIGGFVMSSFAQFTDFTRTENGATTEGKVSDLLGQPSPHGFIILGVRGRLDL